MYIWLSSQLYPCNVTPTLEKQYTVLWKLCLPMAMKVVHQNWQGFQGFNYDVKMSILLYGVYNVGLQPGVIFLHWLNVWSIISFSW